MVSDKLNENNCCKNDDTDVLKYSLLHFFHSLPKMYRWVEYRGGRSRLSCTRRSWGRDLQGTFFFQLYPLQYIKLNNIPNAHANSCGHTFSSLPLTRCKWACLLLSYHLRKFSSSYFIQPATYTLQVDMSPSFMPPTQILEFIPHPACHLHVASGYVSFYDATYANSRVHTSSYLPLTRCTWTCLLLWCHLRKFSSSYLIQPAAYILHMSPSIKIYILYIVYFLHF